jgi:hypothetical protein
MSVERIVHIPEETRVTFELQGSLPIFRETYYAPQAGTVVLKGLINQRAHIELQDGSQYRTMPPRKAQDYPMDLSYPVVHLPDKTPVLTLRTPLKTSKDAQPSLRFRTALDEKQYIYKQVSPGRRGFELWDGMGMQKLVERETLAAKLIPDLITLVPVPALLVLLFPWLDSQTAVFRQP